MNLEDQQPLSLKLPWPPSANKYWRMVKLKNRGSVMLKSQEAREYKEAVDAIFRGIQGIEMLKGPLAISMVFYRPTRTGDTDNRIKIVQDAIQGLLYEDDSQITEIHAYRFDDKHNPRVEIRVKPATPETFSLYNTLWLPTKDLLKNIWEIINKETE